MTRTAETSTTEASTTATSRTAQHLDTDLRCDQFDCAHRTFDPAVLMRRIVGSGEPDLTWTSFMRVHSVACRRIETALVRRHDLTLPAYDVLRAVATEPRGRLRMAALADRVVLSRSGASRVVDGLERQGLVRREPCDMDLRGYFATITEAGLRRFAAATVTHGMAVDSHLLSGLGPQERRTLRDMLMLIAGALGPGEEPSAGRTAGRRTRRVEPGPA